MNNIVVRKDDFTFHYQLWMDNKPALICKKIKFIFKKIEERGYY
jgi:negative regulator of sigma E activity